METTRPSIPTPTAETLAAFTAIVGEKHAITDPDDQKPYLTEDEQLEEVRLKKLKLHAKDLIFAIERRQLAVA